MTSQTLPRTYSIKEAAALTGLPASTLRYYEQIGVIAPVGRGATSKHRVYGERDLDQLMSVSCLSATGMSVSDMRTYMANNEVGPTAAADQRALLEEQRDRLALEAEALAMRQRYVELKIAYWRAVEADDEAGARDIAARAGVLADELRQVARG